VAFPDRRVRRAFTSQLVIDRLKRMGGPAIDNVCQAMNKLVADGVRDLIVQPTFLVNGHEYDKMMAALTPWLGGFDSFRVGTPLMAGFLDFFDLVAELAPALPPAAEGEAVVWMGHGTGHFADSAYATLDYVFKDMGHSHVFVGAVEGYPDLGAVLRRVQARGARKVTLLPLMIVAGDHAKNDMAGDWKGSWKAAFQRTGCEVSCVIKGLGEYPGVREHFVRHVREAIGE
jgi:sirohydrochlorin cobaltochelatase